MKLVGIAEALIFVAINGKTKTPTQLKFSIFSCMFAVST